MGLVPQIPQRRAVRRAAARRIALTVLLLAAGPALAQAVTNSHVEEFDNTTFKDAVNTTADWNTAAGKLKLFPFQPTLLGSYDTPNAAIGVAVSGTVAYVADGTSGLQIINVSNPASPTLIGSYDTPYISENVAVSGTVAYVADGTSGLQIINVSNPASPTLIGNYDTPGYARSVVVSGTVAYVADNVSGLQILDVSNPASPTLLGSYGTPDRTYDVAISGTVVYVADETSGLQIINVSNPASPTLLGSYDTPGIAFGVAVSGTVVYVADHASGLQILDVSNPTSPTLLGSYDTPGFAFGVTVSGTVVYVADATSGLQILNVSNPTSPTLLGSSPLGNARRVAVSGEGAYVADFGSGLQILNVGNTVSPTLVGSYDTPGFAQAAVGSGTVAYVADGAELRILNVGNPVSPTLLGSYDTPGNAQGIAVSGTVVYVADASTGGLQILNVSNPASPTLLGAYDTPGNAQAVAISGTVAYVADVGSGLQIIDVSNPASPTLLGSYDTPGFAYGVAVSGTVAYVADASLGLQIINVANPASPTLLGTYDTPGSAQGVAVSGTVAYVADEGSGLLIINVSNPASPTLLGSYDTPGNAYGVAVSGTVAYVADVSSGLQIINVSNPASPTLIASYDTPGNGLGVAVSGPAAYVADGVSGIQILEVMQNRFDLARNVGRSLAIDGTSEGIWRARITSTQVNNVAWELSANGGANWQAATPGGDWVAFAPGSDLRWRATLSVIPPSLSTGAPDASQVEIEWGDDLPAIESIADVGNDDGRQARLEWVRSGHDFVGSSPQIVEYAIYRRIDPGFAPLGSYAAAAANSAADAERMEALAAGWDFVTTVPAAAEDEYSVLVPTLADSSVADGQHWTAFKVRARTATPGVYYESYPDSGYSKDNLSPAMPAPFAGVFNGGPSQLHWGASTAADFAHYALHRGGTADFVPGPGNLVTAQADTGYVDPGSSWAYYKLAAVDWNGNASGYALVTPAASSSGNTPPGSNVTVAVSPIVEVTYQSVSGGGQTQVTMQTGGPVPPNGLKVAPGAPPIYYLITSTASFTGTVTICVTYDPDFVSGQEHNLKLMHYDTALNPDAWVQVQTTRDTAANEICGVVTHFSTFALMELDPEVVGVEEGAPTVPERLSCAPNPVTGAARIQYDLATAASVRLGLYDVQGRMVRELERSPTASAGRHVVEWDGRGARGERLRAGVYFLWLDTGGARQVRRVVVTR